MRHKKFLIAGGVGVAGLLLIPLSQAFAGSAGPLSGLTGFSQILVDSASGPGYVFLAGSSGITVTDPQGNLITTLDQGEPVSGLALTPGGTTLYASVDNTNGSPSDGGSPTDTGSPSDTGSPADSSPGAYEVDAINVSSIASSPQISPIPLPAGDVPGSLAYQGGTLWISYTDGSGQGAIGSLSVSDSFTPAASGAVGDGWPSAPDLAADPSDDGTLVAVAGAMAQVYSTAGGTLAAGTSTARPTPLGDCAGAAPSGGPQVAVTPGGADFYAACTGSSGSAEVNEYGTSTDLTTPAAPSLPGDIVAVAPDGSLAVGSESSADVYSLSGARLNIAALSSSGSIALGGLAWDGTQLDEVAAEGNSYSFDLTRAAETTTMTLAAKQAAAAYTGHVPISGTVHFSNDIVPAGAEVTITRTGTKGVGHAVIGSSGAFTFTDTGVSKPGTYTYTVAYPKAAPTSVSVRVGVAKNSASLGLSGPGQENVTKSFALTGKLSLRSGTPPTHSKITIKRVWGRQVTNYTVYTAANGTFQLNQSYGGAGKFIYTATYGGSSAMDVAKVSGGHTVKAVLLTATLSLTGTSQYNYEPTMRVTINLGTTYKNRTVDLYAQQVGGKNKLLGAKRVNAKGQYTASFQSKYTTKFTAEFKGDAHYAAKTVTKTDTVVARVTLALKGYYSSKTVDGTVYRLYRYNGELGFTEDVLPGNKYGECGWIETQEYYGSAWHANENTSCTDLSPSSQLISWLSMSKANRGVEYRVRAHFDRSSSDSSDLSGESGWQYIMVES